jgi:hypothetical protein
MRRADVRYKCAGMENEQVKEERAAVLRMKM